MAEDGEASDKPIDSVVLIRMRQFGAMNNEEVCPEDFSAFCPNSSGVRVEETSSNSPKFSLILKILSFHGSQHTGEVLKSCTDWGCAGTSELHVVAKIPSTCDTKPSPQLSVTEREGMILRPFNREKKSKMGDCLSRCLDSCSGRSKPDNTPNPPPSNNSPGNNLNIPEKTQQLGTQNQPDSPLSSQVEEGVPLLLEQYVDIRSMFMFGKELQRGQLEITSLCTEKETGRRYACKCIDRKKLVNEEDFRREVNILKRLSGQPNVVEFKGAYEDRENLYLVMELCSGGELFDRIIARASYSERDAARIFKEIVNVVHVCHSMGVMHRALKPENFLLVNQGENSPLKATDFGDSVFIEQGKVYKDIVSSTYYIAPEMLRQNYGKEIDVWSAGVILYILLSGVPPFLGDTKKTIFEAILEGKVDLQSSPWPSISASAKDLIVKMLEMDPRKRITAADALKHPWLKEDREDFDKPLDSAVLIRMKQIRTVNKMKKLALKNLSEEDIHGLKQMFYNMDTDESGSITLEELKTGLSRLGSNLSESEIQQLMDAADVDGNGAINYFEFTNAAIHRHRLERDESLYKAFRFFDKDGSGYITREELRQVMTQHGMGDEATIDGILDGVDVDKDGKISYEEFVVMMRRGAQYY
ncbi:Parvalbumin [Parasponia andersonii]|uniref:Parvalbumin n=1 Tax=Parasponia andersonii TaxID=3476 RepID=A0A2P5A559_PARAD|nr:Parvalbumin [Parasponia andersonii]